jgi:hypothetical protein
LGLDFKSPRRKTTFNWCATTKFILPKIEVFGFKLNNDPSSKGRKRLKEGGNLLSFHFLRSDRWKWFENDYCVHVAGAFFCWSANQPEVVSFCFSFGYSNNIWGEKQGKHSRRKEEKKRQTED